MICVIFIAFAIWMPLFGIWYLSTVIWLLLFEGRQLTFAIWVQLFACRYLGAAIRLFAIQVELLGSSYLAFAIVILPAMGLAQRTPGARRQRGQHDQENQRRGAPQDNPFGTKEHQDRYRDRQILDGGRDAGCLLPQYGEDHTGHAERHDPVGRVDEESSAGMGLPNLNRHFQAP